MKRKVFSFVGLIYVLICIPVAAQNPEYAGLSVEDCIRIALQNSRLTGIASRDIEIAQSKIRQAESGNRPQLNLSGIFLTQDQPPNFVFPSMTVPVPSFNLGFGDIVLPPVQIPAQNIKLANKTSIVTELTLTLPLYTGGRITSFLDQAKSGLDISRNDSCATVNELIYNIRKAYYGLIAAGNVLSLGEEASERMRATLKLTESLYKNGSGSVSKLDYLQNKMAFESLQSVLAVLRGNRQTALNALRFLMGIEDSSRVSASAEEIPIFGSGKTLDDLIAEADSSNTTLIKLNAVLEYYKAKIAEAKSGWYPSVALIGNYTRLDNNYDYGLSTKENKNVWTVGLGMSWSVFNGFRTNNEIGEAEAYYEKTELQKKYFKQYLVMQITELFEKAAAARQRIEASAEAVRTASENRDLTQRAYQIDMAPVKDFIQAQLLESFLKAQHQQALFELADLEAKMDLLTGVSDKR